MADKTYCQLSMQKPVSRRMKYRGSFLTAVRDTVQMSKISTARNLRMRAELECLVAFYKFCVMSSVLGGI